MIGKGVNAISMIGKGIGKLVVIVFYLLLIMVMLSSLGAFGESAASPARLYGSGEDKVAIIDIAGTIADQDTSGGFGASAVSSPRGIIRAFEEVRDDESVKAIVLRINSPGGTVTASEEIYQLIRSYRDDLSLPIIASMSDVAASGGYYVSLAADHIVANKSTLTGSIGVIFQTYNFEELANEYGVKSVTVASGENKDFLNPLEPVSEEQIAILQRLTDEAYGQFVGHVSERRPIEPATLAEVADGRVLSGEQALQVGLVDSVGTLQDAVNVALRQANINEASVVVYGEKSFLDMFLGVMSRNSLLKSFFPGTEPLMHLSGKPAYYWGH